MYAIQQKPLHFAIAHIFTDGRDSLRHSILHFACIRYKNDKPPQMNEWLINPGLKEKGTIKKRVVNRTGIDASHVRDKPLWHEIHNEVRSSIEEVDFIFVRNSNVASQWFEKVIFAGRKSPQLIGLTEMYQFFLPEEPVPYSESTLIDLGDSITVYHDNRKLHKVMNGMYGMMDSILRVILSRKEVSTEVHHPVVYSLLDWALSAEGNQPSFDALFKVASIAHNIQWNQSQTEIQFGEDQTGEVFIESPIKMEETELIKYIKNWKPSNLILEDRKPLRESFMASEILSQHELDNSAKNLFQILRFIANLVDQETDSTQRFENVLNKVESPLHKMQNAMFEIIRRLYYLEDWRNKGSSGYLYRYEELCEYSGQLCEYLENITDQLKLLCEDELYIAQLKWDDHQLGQIISKWITQVSERSQKLQKLMEHIQNQFPAPDTPQLNTHLRQAINEFIKFLQDLSREYWNTTNPILKEYSEQDFKELFSAMGKSFVTRSEQQKYAKFIKEGINIGGMYAIEAGTGTGKTLGYLIPACEHMRVNEKRQVIIATATINLMDQIVRKDWAALTSSNDSPYHGLQITVLKGKRNYLCASAVKECFSNLNADEVEKDSRITISDQRIAWIYLFQILTRKNGQWDNLDGSTNQYSKVASQIIAQFNIIAEDVCKPDLCKMGLDCSYPQAVRRAQYADVVITNHHKLAFIEDEILKRTSVCIIDEADQFPDNLRHALKVSLEKNNISDFIQKVGIQTANRRNFVEIVRDSIASDLLKNDLPQELRKYITDKMEQKIALNHEDFEHIFLHLNATKINHAREFLNSLVSIEDSCQTIKTCLRNSTNIESRKSDVRFKGLPMIEQKNLMSTLDIIANHCEIVELEFQKIVKISLHDQKTLRIQPPYIDRIKRYVHEVTKFKNTALNLLDAIPNQQYVITFGQKSYNWIISMIPFEIHESVLRLRKDFETLLFTSATLYVDKTLWLFILELLDRPDLSDPFTGSKQIKPLFKYDKQVAGAVTSFILEYNFPPTNEWVSEIATIIALQSIALDGRTLVLFNSWNEMNDIFERLRPIFRSYDIPLLIQDRHGSSEKIIQEFQGFEESVLLGTGRFWSGVDFPGPTLSQLIIIRAPNANPRAPLVEERKKRWRKQFYDIWYSFRAQRKLHQGFGRLIRKSTDKGLLIILDPRMITSTNMRSYQEAIPVSLKSDLKCAVELAHWAVKSQGLTPELEDREIVLREAYENIKSMAYQVPPSQYAHPSENS